MLGGQAVKDGRWLDVARRMVGKTLLAAVLGWAALGVGFAIDARRAFHAYLTAYLWALTLALGALIFLVIVNAMNAVWPVAVRRLAEQVSGTLPVLAVLFVPIFIGLSSLYPWMTPEQFSDPHLHRLVMHRRAYYNVPFFVVRWVISFGLWIALAAMFRRWSLRQELGDGMRWRKSMVTAAVAGMIPLALTLSTASFDWLMSLTPTWYSSLFGIYFFAGSFLSGLALIAALAWRTRKREELSRLQPSHFYALGRLLLAFTAFWAYNAYFQFMLIWIANRPLEGEWYVRRESGWWRLLSVCLVIGQFAVPFVLLLSYRLKRSASLLGLLAIWVIAFHYVDVYWMVMPAYATLGFRPSWIDAAALIAVGCTEAAVASALLRGQVAVAVGDPLLSKAMEYRAR
jgi:hypothetical protein